MHVCMDMYVCMDVYVCVCITYGSMCVCVYVRKRGRERNTVRQRQTQWLVYMEGAGVPPRGLPPSRAGLERGDNPDIWQIQWKQDSESEVVERHKTPEILWMIEMKWEVEPTFFGL